MSGLEFEPGSTVSHFRLERKLGEGGMGAVYLAEDLTLSRKVAIKFMSRSLLAKQAKPEVREALEMRFIREAKSAGAINHPNLCQIYEANFDSDDWYIAMEYINGKDLIDRFEDQGQFPPNEIVDVCRQTAAGLKFAWDHYKIVHRDIKPRNIMLTQQGMVKIVDLGLAKPIAGPDEEHDMPDVTMAGTAIGTPQYMAPEQATGETNIDYMVDIYALGATLYEMCTGEKAFNERTPTMIYMAQMSRKYKPINEFRTDIPDGLISLINDMLEPQRADRIESYDNILGRARALCVPDGMSDIDVTAASLEVTQIAATIFKDYPVDHLILDRYRVMKYIGRSRAGVVYKCFDSELGMECAVKSLAPGREFSTEDMAIVRENYQKLMGVTDPNLVQIRDIRQNDITGELFIIMELLEGTNLREYTHRQYMENSKLDLHTVIPVFRRIAKAIDRLNGSLGMPHNDIKPESIFIQNDSPEIKLLDYGVTMRPFSNNSTVPGIDTEGSREYLVPLENTDYMAPEKWEHGAATQLADQYAFALVVYEMLARRLPLWTNNPDNSPETGTHTPTEAERARFERMRDQVLTEAIPQIETLNKNINAAFQTALSKDPESRFSNSQAFIQRLARAAGIREKNIFLPIIAGAALIACGVTGYVIYTQRELKRGLGTESSSYAKKTTEISGKPLSQARLNQLLQPALDARNAAEEEQNGATKLKKLKDANALLVEATKKIDAEVASLTNKANNLKQTLDNNLSDLKGDTLGKTYAPNIQQTLDSAANILELDSRVVTLEACKKEIKAAWTAARETRSKLDDSVSNSQRNVNKITNHLRTHPLSIQQYPQATRRLKSLTDEEKLIKEHDTKNPNKLERSAARWKQLSEDCETARVEYAKWESSLRKEANARKQDFLKEYDRTKTEYSSLNNDFMQPVERARDEAIGLMNTGEFHLAQGSWAAASAALTNTNKRYQEIATELRKKAADGRKKYEAEAQTIKTHPLSKELLAESEATATDAGAKVKPSDLPEAIQLWEKALQQLGTAKKELKQRIAEAKIRSAEERLERQKEIRRIRNTYPKRYATLKNHEFGQDLLANVQPPEEALATIPDGADDPKSMESLHSAETMLKQAENQLAIRIQEREAKLRTQALTMLETYNKKREELLKNPLAEEMLIKANDSAKVGTMAMKEKDYGVAIVSLTEATSAMNDAELRLKELMHNEQLRKVALAKQLKAKLKRYAAEYKEGRAKLVESELVDELIAPMDAKANQAQANADLNPDISLKRWQEVLVDLKAAEAELAITLKAREESKAATARKLTRDVTHLKEGYAEKRTELAENPFAIGRFVEADEFAEKAKVAMTADNMSEAKKQWKSAMNQLENLEGDLQADQKTQAEKRQKAVVERRQEIKQWEDWDPEIGEKLVSYDVTLAMARGLMEQQDWADAGKQLGRCQEILNNVEAFVKENFIATPGKDFRLGKVGLELVWIDKMKLWVGKFEVTNEQYRHFKPKHSSRKHEGLSMNGPTQPVCWINYFDAVAYCTWLSNIGQMLRVTPADYEFRLPSKEEWATYASCGNKSHKYPWGDTWPPKQGNFANQEIFPQDYKLKGYTDEFPVTCPVEKSGKNEWGLFGVSGNLWEWTTEKLNANRAVFGGAWESTIPRLMQVDLNDQNFADPQRDYDNVGFRALLAPKK